MTMDESFKHYESTFKYSLKSQVTSNGYFVKTRNSSAKDYEYIGNNLAILP